MCNVCDENEGCSMLGEYRFKYLRLVAQNNDGLKIISGIGKMIWREVFCVIRLFN